MPKRSALLFLQLVLAAYMQAQTIKNFSSTINYLSSPELAGRSIGSEGIVLAENYLVQEYKKMGLRSYEKKRDFRQSFNVPDTVKGYEKTKCTNIIAVLDNKADSTIVISAHYDGVGKDERLMKDVLASKRKTASAGADDNASGVSMVLELVRELKAKKNVRYNIVAVHCSAHETGLFGSQEFFKSNFFRSLKVKEVINVDMIGRLNTKTQLIKIGRSAESTLFRDTTGAFSKFGIRMEFSSDQLWSSDATVFWKNGFKTVTITTGIHDDYHRSSDTPEKINYEGMHSIWTMLCDEIKKTAVYEKK
jgi:Zn-dependent M28 family amino/carboxypeptidase